MNNTSIVQHIFFYEHSNNIVLDKKDPIIKMFHLYLDWIHFLGKQKGINSVEDLYSWTYQFNELFKYGWLMAESSTDDFLNGTLNKSIKDKVENGAHEFPHITSDQWLDLTYMYGQTFEQMNQFKKADKFLFFTECIKDKYIVCENNLSEK